MAIEGFNYQEFAEILSSQAGDLLPANFKDFQKNYVINTIKNFAALSGEALYNDDKSSFTADQAMLITQIIAEWTFHKSVDIIKAGILPEHWDGVMQKIAFTIFEVAKQGISKNISQDELLRVVEHQVKNTYQNALEELKNRNVINEAVFENAEKQSNIDEMMQQIQEEKQQEEAGQQIDDANHQANAKILKLASVALLLKQVSQDKVQTILNKFNPQDAHAVIQYMQMPDLENKVDKSLAMKFLQEIKTNLPEPKIINPNKLLARMNNVYTAIGKENVEKITKNERDFVKDFITKSQEGEYSGLPTKVANIIVQHLEESVV